MGFLRAAADGQEPDPANEGAELEKTYLRMFPKIGRDFVHQEDLAAILLALLDALDVDPALFGKLLEVSPRAAAVKRALEYKAFLDLGKDSNVVYRDIINLDDD